MNLLRSLQNHHDACEEIYRVMLDINRILKAGLKSPDDALLDRQRLALAMLERALTAIPRHERGSSPEARAALEKCQRTIMKALLLDRENEQLLLKNAMVRTQPPKAPKPTPHLLSRTYAKH